MKCPNCGSEEQHGRFCMACGAPMPVPPPMPTTGPAASEPVTPPPTVLPPQEPAAPPQKKRGCLKGCLWTLLAVVLIVGVVVAIAVDLPVRLGLTESDAEHQLGHAPDLRAAEAILVEFESYGQSRDGIDVYVFPLEGEERSLAYVILDETEGFVWGSDEGGVPVREHLIWVAESDMAARVPIVRVAVEYIDDVGDSILAITATTDDIKAFGDGEITEDEFFQRADARADMEDMLMQWTGWFQ